MWGFRRNSSGRTVYSRDCPPPPPDVAGFRWKASGGRNLLPSEMTIEHLCNALNWIESADQWNSVPNVEQMTNGYFYLRREAERRGLNYRKFDNSKLQDGDLFYTPSGGGWFFRPRGSWNDNRPHLTQPLYPYYDPARVVRHFEKYVRPGRSHVPGEYKELGDVAAGTTFCTGMSQQARYLKLMPIGHVRRHLEDEHVIRDDGGMIRRGDRHETLRYMVCNKGSGHTFLMPSYQKIYVLSVAQAS